MVQLMLRKGSSVGLLQMKLLMLLCLCTTSAASQDILEGVWNYRDIPAEGTWTTWTPWDACSLNCGGGHQSRNRDCIKEFPHEVCFNGNASETVGCNEQPCPVDGAWSPWVTWQACGATCGTTSRQRTRLCDLPAPAHGGLNCPGSGFESEVCGGLPLCPIHGGWTLFSPWSACPVGCGPLGNITRSRSCTNPTPQHGGTVCPGEAEQALPCDPCPVHGAWTLWTTWSTCNIGCGTSGLHTRSRTCTNPAPDHGGNDCSGASSDQKACDPCPIDGEWTNWSVWSTCPVGCGPLGNLTRSRTCTNPAPQYGGEACAGADEEATPCDPCPVHGNWAAWTTWSVCNITCGADGGHSRTRTCTNPAPEHGGNACAGSDADSKACDPCPVHGAWDTWSPWGQCNITCGEAGVHTRNRNCSRPEPEWGGDPCTGSSTDSMSCGPCPLDHSLFGDLGQGELTAQWITENTHDGNFETFWHSQTNTNEWLQLDLLQVVDVYRIVLMGRFPSTGSVERFYGYQSRVGNQLTVPTDTTITWNTVCGTMPGTSTVDFHYPRNYVYTCDNGPLTGQYVTIQRTNGNAEHTEISDVFVWISLLPIYRGLQHRLLCFDVADYQGFDITMTTTADVWDCRDDCYATANCVYFVWDETNDECHLRDSYHTLWHSGTLWSGSILGDGCLYD